MKITIITPTYNSEKTIERTIKSILSQSYNNIEHIIVDGKSTDKTIDIVKKYQEIYPIKLFSEIDKGIYDAMNKGIELSTGEIINILNSDDVYDNDQVLKMVVSVFKDNKRIDAVYGDIKYFSNDTNKNTRVWRAGNYNEKKLNNGWIIPHPALFVKKSVYEKYGKFNLKFTIAADYEFILRILKIHKIKCIYVPTFFVKMYNDGKSAKNIKQRIIGWKELKMAWKINKLKTPKFFIFRRIIFKVSQYILK